MDPITWRFVERILAVAIGGMAIYLGYRLFVKVPESRDSQGRLVLPWNITIILSRVGPGVFFALFGALVVAYALHASVSFTRETIPSELGTASAEREIFGGMTPTAGNATAAARLSARSHIEFLNSLSLRLLPASATESKKQNLKREITALKLAVMRPLWRRDVWGDFAAFKDWAEGDAADPVPAGLEAAAAYYRAGLEEVK
jgi:hypothetical protein